MAAPCPPCNNNCRQGHDCQRQEFEAALERHRAWQAMRRGDWLGGNAPRQLARPEPHACGITGPAITPTTVLQRWGLAVGQWLG